MVSDGPPGLSGHKFIYNKTDRCFYLVGGWRHMSSDEKSNYYRNLWRYNSSTRSWVQIIPSNAEATPIAMASHCAHFIGPQTLLHFGGSLSIVHQFGNSAACTIFDLASQQWQSESLVTKGPDSPDVNCGHWFGRASTLSPCGTKLYVASGMKRRGVPCLRSVLELHMLNLRIPSWTILTNPDTLVTSDHTFPPPNYARIRHEIAIHGDKIYIFGGSEEFPVHGNGTIFELKTLACFDLHRKCWSFVETIPDPEHDHPKCRTSFGMCKWKDDSVYISGGFSENDSLEFEVLNDVWKFHFPSLSWHCIDWKMPIPIWFHSMDISNWGELNIFGGCPTTSYEHRTPTVQKVVVELGTLKELSLAKLMNVFEHLEKSDRMAVEQLTGFLPRVPEERTKHETVVATNLKSLLIRVKRIAGHIKH